MVVQLPALTGGEVVTAADLSMFLAAIDATVAYNVDLYGLGFRSSATVLVTDYWGTPFDTTDATLLMDNLFVKTMSTEIKSSLPVSAATALASYVQQQYQWYGWGRIHFPPLLPGPGDRLQAR